MTTSRAGRRSPARNGHELDARRAGLDRVEPPTQPVVGVVGDVADAREVLQPAATPADWSPRTIAATSSPDRRRVVAERADPDRRVRRVRREVADRRVGDVHAHRPQLQADRPPDPLGEVRVAGRAERHVAGERRRAVAEGHGAGRPPGRRRRAAVAAAAVARPAADAAWIASVSSRTWPASATLREPEERHPGGRRAGQPARRSGGQPLAVEGEHQPRRAEVALGSSRCAAGGHPLTAPGEPADELALEDDEEDEDRDDVIVTPAAIDRKSELNRPWSAASPTGSVIPSRVWSMSDGHRKSFHDVTNVKIATAASDGRTIGSRTLHQIRISQAPSTRAASMRSFGTPSERLAQQEDVEGAHEVRKDQGEQRVVVVEDVDRQHEARDVGQLDRHDQRREQQVEDRVAAGEPHLRQRVGRQRGDQHVEEPRPRPTTMTLFRKNLGIGSASRTLL